MTLYVMHANRTNSPVLDFSLLRLEKGVFQVLATGGDTALGGDELSGKRPTIARDSAHDNVGGYHLQSAPFPGAGRHHLEQ